MLVQINLHGQLGEAVGASWRLAVSSVGEAIRAIDTNTKRALTKFLYEKDQEGLRYRVLINERDCLYPEEPNVSQPETVTNSELCMNHRNLRTIDIVPVIEGGKKVFTIVLGAVLVIAGFFVGGPIGAGLVIAGLGLVAAGVTTLLSSPPKFADFRQFDGTNGRGSSLFNGPENLTNEGGPVPIGYGRLIIGSQTIAASYDITDVASTNA